MLSGLLFLLLSMILIILVDFNVIWGLIILLSCWLLLHIIKQEKYWCFIILAFVFLMVPRGFDTISSELKVVDVRDYGVFAVEKKLFPKAVQIYRSSEKKYTIGDEIRLQKDIVVQIYKAKPWEYKVLPGGEPVVCKLNESIIKDIKPNPTMLNKIRGSIECKIDGLFTPNNSALIKKMLLGVKENNDNTILLSEFGLAHIMSISGLHIGLLFGLLLWIITNLGLSYNNSKAMSLFICWGYGIMVGLSAPVTRALIMISIPCIFEYYNRHYFADEGILLAAIIILFFRPYQAFSLGFQLSFLSIWGILVLAPSLIRKLKKHNIKIDWLVYYAAAMIMTLPLQVHHFGKIPIWGAVVNWIYVPFYSLVLHLCLPLLILPAVITKPMAIVLNLALDGGHFLLNLVKQIFPVSYSIYLSSPYYIIFYYLGVFAFVKCPRKTPSLSIGKTAIAVLALWYLSVSIFYNSEGLSITFVDVGQGDAIFIKEGKHGCLIDVGGSPYYDVGRKLVVPALKKQGISKIDALFISHWDIDHVGGLEAVCKAYPIDNIFASYIPIDSSDFGIEKVEDVKILERGDKVKWRDYEFEILWPITQDMPLNDNERSMVMRFGNGDNSVLLTGDIENNAEHKLSKYENLNSNIIKLGHHGSKFSSSTNLLNAVGPELAIISCGRGNSYGHPHNEVLDRLKDGEINYYRTDTMGDITLSLEGELSLVENSDIITVIFLIVYGLFVALIMKYKLNLEESIDGLHRI
ncbi:MAG: DNA internalization-related competence protein ComEC/Rec2 [Tissierellia bacterium]|nr:DNA internalization-related competence protein ComEC/Rec2 [Tissierellia bacterium]